MKTPILDDYIFNSFRRLDGCRIDTIKFALNSDHPISKELIVNLFPNVNISFVEEDSKSRAVELKYFYILYFPINGTLNETEYALLVGKILMLSSKIGSILVFYGIDA